jgi:hypothetical protein
MRSPIRRWHATLTLVTPVTYLALLPNDFNGGGAEPALHRHSKNPMMMRLRAQ